MFGRNSCGQAISLLNSHFPPDLQNSTSPNLQSSRPQHDVLDLLIESSTFPGRSQSSQSITSSRLFMPHSPSSKEQDHPPGFIPLYFTNATAALPAKVKNRQSMHSQTFLGLSVSCSMSYRRRLELPTRSIEDSERMINYPIRTLQSAYSILAIGSVSTFESCRDSWVSSKVSINFPGEAECLGKHNTKSESCSFYPQNNST